MARPTKEFDSGQFEALCRMWCTESEICSFFATTDKTLTKWIKRHYHMDFSEAYKKFSEEGNISLRRAQYKSAVDRENVTMMIWLGKQYLGQSDQYQVHTEQKLEYDPLSSAFKELEKMNGKMDDVLQTKQETVTDTSVSE